MTEKLSSGTHLIQMENVDLEGVFDMNTKKGYLRIAIVLSIVPVIVGMLMVLFSGSGSACEKIVGLATAVIGPVVIWGVYGCAFFAFKG